MKRNITTTEGGLSIFYPDVFAPKLVLDAEFKAKAAHYVLRRYNGGTVILDFVIRNDGSRVDLS
jgi:hypothetical protein